MSEPQPPDWWRPPVQPVPLGRPPERPRFRESRPVRWWMVLLGVVASALWYVLIGVASWSVVSFIVGMLAGMLLAAVASWLLTWKGDSGLGVGVGMMLGLALAFTIVLWGFYTFFEAILAR